MTMQLNIMKPLQAPNGASVEFHRVTGVSLSSDMVNLEALLESWPNLAAYSTGQEPVARSMLRINADTMPAAATLMGRFKLALVASGAFEGGTVVDPEAASLSAQKAMKWASIKAKRDQIEFSTFTANGNIFDAHVSSQSRIQGAALLATNAIASNSAFSIDWTLSDNSVVTLDAAGMIQVGMAMAAHINAAHAQARVLRVVIESATTVEAVEAVTWPS